jgi:hypothetical protein
MRGDFRPASGDEAGELLSNVRIAERECNAVDERVVLY